MLDTRKNKDFNFIPIPFYHSDIILYVVTPTLCQVLPAIVPDLLPQTYLLMIEWRGNSIFTSACPAGLVLSRAGPGWGRKCSTISSQTPYPYQYYSITSIDYSPPFYWPLQLGRFSSGPLGRDQLRTCLQWSMVNYQCMVISACRPASI